MSSQPKSPIESGTGQKPAPWKWASWLVLPTVLTMWFGYWWIGLAGVALSVCLSLQYALVRIQGRPFAKPAPLQMRGQTIIGTAVTGLLVHTPIWIGDIVLTLAWNWFSRLRHHRGRRVRDRFDRFRHGERHEEQPRKSPVRVPGDDDPTWPPHDEGDDWYRGGAISMPQTKHSHIAIGTSPLREPPTNPVERAVRWIVGR